MQEPEQTVHNTPQFLQFCESLQFTPHVPFASRQIVPGPALAGHRRTA